MNPSNFDKVLDFHNTFELAISDSPTMDVFDSNTKLVNLRLGLIREEVSELEEAVKEKDMVETLDALVDILYVVYGAGVSFGLDLDLAFDLVHKSNMSKLCKTEDDAKDSVAWYKSKFENGESLYDSPAYKLSSGGVYWIIYNESSGKILKSINYAPVRFGSLFA